MDSGDVRYFVPDDQKEIPNRHGWVLQRQLYHNDRQQSQVWLGQHIALGFLVFKFFHDTGGGPTGFLRILQRELDLRQALGSDGENFVSRIVDAHVEAPRDGQEYAPFIALEYYSEGSLAKAILDENGLLAGMTSVEAERTLLDLVAQVAELVHQLHCRGVFHGDVRAANVLIRRNVSASRRVARLTDLGNGGYLDGVRPESNPPNGTMCPPQTSSAPGDVREDREPEQAPQGYLGMQDVLAHETDSSSTGGTQPVQVPPRSQESVDRVAGDIAQIGTMLYQCVLNSFDLTLDLRGVWQDQIRCPVLRKIIEDSQRAGAISSAEKMAQRLRDIGMSRLRRRFWRFAAAATIPFVIVAIGWWHTVEHLRLTQFLKLQEEQARTREIIRGGDVAVLAGAWEEARSLDRAALARLDLTSTQDKAHLHERILRASLFLDDSEAVEREIQALAAQGNLGSCAPAVRLDQAVRELELAMRESAGTGLMPSRHEALAVSLLRQVVDDPDAAPTDQLTAQGLLASTYAEAERCFEGALAQDAFHPYATVYLVSTSLLAGRLEKAAAHAHVWQMMSRKDPAPLLYEGFILALLGKHHEAKQVMKGINIPAGGGPVLSNQTFAAYQAVMDIAAAIQDMLAEALLDPIARLKFVVLLATKLPAAVGGFAKTGVFRVPLTPAQRQAFHQFLEAVKLGNLPFQAQPVVALERLHGDNPFVPAGLVLFFRGKCHLDLGDKAKAAEAFEQAATQPAFFDIRRLCWLAVANYRVGLATRAKPDDAERLKRAARVLIRQAVVLGTMTAAFREKVIELLIQSDGLDFAEELAAEGGNQKTLEKVQRLRGAR